MPVLTRTPLAASVATAGDWLAEAVLGHPEARSGSYLDRDRIARSSPESYHPERERALWEGARSLGSLRAGCGLRPPPR